MYVGRIVALGRERNGRLAAMYRVSSRSFPNRQAVVGPRSAAIVPKPGFEGDVFKNPYIAYNCLRLVGDCAVAGNGSHTDPVAEKIESGVPVRDALVSVLLAMDYERDSYDTPRIAAVARAGGDRGFVGIVRRDALLVREFELTPGMVFYVCTYEHNEPRAAEDVAVLDANDPERACQYVLGQGIFAGFERPVTAACAVVSVGGEFEIATRETAQSPA